MPRFCRFLLLLGLSWTCTVLALSPQAEEVLAIAPGLRGFAGSEANLDSLASGLRLGKTITLTTITPSGMREVLKLTPAASLTAQETVNVLEATRFELLSLDMPDPTGWEIGIVLVGGSVVTPHGNARVPGLVLPADPSRPLSLSMRAFSGSLENQRNLVAGLTSGRRVTLTVPGNGRRRISFTPIGPPLAAREVKPVLIAASELLAAHGIEDPTPEELRAALVGGAVDLVPSGKAVLRGVLEERAAKIAR